MGLCKVRFCLTESTQAFEAHFLSSAALSSLHGCSCGCLADMEELSAAAATLAVSMDVADIDDLGVEDTNITAGAAKVLSATSTCSNFYTGLKLESKTHFYGRAAAEEVLAGFLSALLRPTSGRRGFSR